jgi:thymidylate kinase
MIIELFGPPGSGKTTLLRALCLELTAGNIPLKTVNGYRRIDSVSFGSDVDSSPEVRHGIDRLVRKLAATSPILLSQLPREGVAARLLATIPPKSRMWALRQKIDLALLCQAWSTARTSNGIYIFEEGFVQSLCALVLLGRNPGTGRIRDCLTFLPRPDLLIYVDAPDDVLRQRLVGRHARQTLSSRLLEIGLERDLEQAHVARKVCDCLRQARWPMMPGDGVDRQSVDAICSHIERTRVATFATDTALPENVARQPPQHGSGLDYLT